jgi:hypothetical protein
VELMVRFFAVPQYVVETAAVKPPADREKLEPGPNDPVLVSRAIERVEFRGSKLGDHVARLLSNGPGPVVLARSPNDLPALLRTADQLRTHSIQDSQGRPQVFHCACGAAYNVPISLFRPLSIRCDRCGRVVELASTRLSDSRVSELSLCRDRLSDFFRESMARGWLVMVEQAPDVGNPA